MEQTQITIICALIAFTAYIIGRVGYGLKQDKQEKSDYDMMNESINNAINEEENKTRNLLIRTLEDIGCQPEINDNNDIVFKYQGEEFKILANNDSLIIGIYNVAWIGIETSDTNADFLKQAVNKANEDSAITNLYTINEEKGFIVAHCQTATYFAYNIPDCREYLKSILDTFFFAHQRVEDEFTNLAKVQEQKERVVVKGFSSD